MKKIAGAVVGAALSLLAAREAEAFCGFYVGGAEAKLFNNATLVVLMREGQRTVLSMQNNYQGPPSDFAMVIPVPVVLQKENVKTLQKNLFDKVDQLGAPRLVEYWEQDPCAPLFEYKGGLGLSGIGEGGGGRGDGIGLGSKVKVEARFEVGEYDVVILSAKDSTALDQWLRENKYKIPEGAEPHLKPYVTEGSKFFVAKVNIAKVKFENGQAMLSPLRFHYDTDKFTLPIRLGLINSGGTQDLIVNILARKQRFEVANYPNAIIPTNLDVAPEAREKFGAMYAALFDKTIEANPKAVITEYAWDASTCDPCPTPALTTAELKTLGADALPMEKTDPPTDFVLTRLHARYPKDGVSEDLVFKTADAIEGGREIRSTPDKVERGAKKGGTNNFQARYAIRHPWTGPVKCEKPVRGRWGGPPRAGDAGGEGIKPPPVPAAKLAFAPRGGVKLASLLKEDLPDLKIVAEALPAAVTAPTASAPPAPSAAPATSAPPAPKPSSCGCVTAGMGGDSLALGAFGALAFALAWRRKRS
jgi:hypothetical protein